VPVLDVARQLLIGAYFSREYSFEAAALFNPSTVPYPNQGGLADGKAHFVLSLRATGERHISSICFRSGGVDPTGEVRLDPPVQRATMAELNGTGLAEGNYDAVFALGTSLAERVYDQAQDSQVGQETPA
jgi:hypothetical protein